MGGKRKTEEDYKNLAGEKDVKWKGEELPQSVHVKTEWECSLGHLWRTKYHSLEHSIGCPYCAGKTSKTLTDYKNLSIEKGIEWLGPFPSATHNKTWWRCQSNHKWAAPFNQIRQNHGCPYCAGKVPKTEADYFTLAEKMGVHWQGPMVKQVITKTQWLCDRQHLFKASYHSVRKGSGCPICAGNEPKTAIDYEKLADAMHFKWVGIFPRNTATKTEWMCVKKHRWLANYSNIKNGSGCPECVDIVNGRKVSGIQRDLCVMVNGELNYPCLSFNIDVALPNDRIAIEYDSWFWHGNRLENDRRRDEELIEVGWRILHVRSNGKLPTEAQLNNAIIQLQSGEDKTEIVLDDWGHGPIFTSFT